VFALILQATNHTHGHDWNDFRSCGLISQSVNATGCDFDSKTHVLSHRFDVMMG
jgi:hypothetical protein